MMRFEHQQLVRDLMEPSLHPVHPASDPIELLVDPAQISKRVALGLRHPHFISLGGAIDAAHFQTARPVAH